MINRRNFLKGALAGSSALALGACATPGGRARPHVVVVGGGFGGATAAKYLRLWSEGAVDVTLVERNPRFISCPMSNLVIAGLRNLSDVTLSYDGLVRHGVKVIQGEVEALDAQGREIRLGSGERLSYDRVIVSPGIDFIYDDLPGMQSDPAQRNILHAWKAGPQTQALRQQLEAMRDGGVYVMTIPKAPYRCPPGTYERACLVAHYLKTHKPRSKVIVLDANAEIISKKPLFSKVFAEQYKNLIEYHPNSELRDVDAANLTAILEFDRVGADVLNVVPAQRAGHIARAAGLKLINDRWVEVDWLSMESKSTPGVHAIGDAIFPAPTMPKSGHMANQHAKIAAAAILDLLEGRAPNPAPLAMNTCYSFVDDRNAIHVSSVHRYDAEKQTLQPVKGAGGLSVAPNQQEGQIALDWAKNIWADTLD